VRPGGGIITSHLIFRRVKNIDGESSCMKLQEYQSKQYFSKFGIPIPKGRVAATANEAKQIAEELGSRVVVKSQVLVGGRGKAGGIRLAKSPEEAEEMAGQILAMEISKKSPGKHPRRSSGFISTHSWVSGTTRLAI
jgi:hypothetical protein